MADALAAAYDLHRNRDPAAFGRTLVRALALAFECDGAVLAASDPAPPGYRIEAWPERLPDGFDAAAAARLHAEGRHGIRAIRLPGQLLMPLASPDREWRVIALHRGDRDFDAEDCATLEALWPHITLAQRNARRELRARSPSLAPVHAEEAAGVVVVRSDCRVTLCSEQARLWLAEWFGARAAGPPTLPPAIHAWASARIADEAAGRRLRAERPDPLIVPRGEHCLVADLVVDHGTGLHLMRLEKVALSAPAASLEAMGLTARESEVLCWVAQGKTNREVGLILGASGRTVQKHLEHIFQKIGVESRTAAILKAWQAGRSAALA